MDPPFLEVMRVRWKMQPSADAVGIRCDRYPPMDRTLRGLFGARRGKPGRCPQHDSFVAGNGALCELPLRARLVIGSVSPYSIQRLTILLVVILQSPNLAWTLPTICWIWPRSSRLLLPTILPVTSLTLPSASLIRPLT